jgi:hypothetical protein
LTSCVEREPEAAAPAAAGVAPPSEGALGSADVGAAGVAAGVADGVADGVAAGVAVAAAACGFDDEPVFDMPIIVCTAYAIASASTQPSTITIFFCFSAFALAASATFFRAMSCSSPAD